MPARTSGKLVELKTDLVESLKKYAEFKDREEKDITNLANNLLWETLTREMLNTYMKPEIEALWVKINSVYLKDKKTEQISEITLNNYKLRCNTDKSEDCKHIWYTMGATELGKLVNLKDEIKKGRWNRYEIEREMENMYTKSAYGGRVRNPHEVPEYGSKR